MKPANPRTTPGPGSRPRASAALVTIPEHVIPRELIQRDCCGLMAGPLPLGPGPRGRSAMRSEPLHCPRCQRVEDGVEAHRVHEAQVAQCRAGVACPSGDLPRERDRPLRPLKHEHDERGGHRTHRWEALQLVRPGFRRRRRGEERRLGRGGSGVQQLPARSGGLQPACPVRMPSGPPPSLPVQEGGPRLRGSRAPVFAHTTIREGGGLTHTPGRRRGDPPCGVRCLPVPRLRCCTGLRRVWLPVGVL